MVAKSTGTALAINQDQRKVYESMSDALQREADKAINLKWKMVDNEVWGRFELGLIVRRVIGDETKYGEGAVKRLATVLDEHPNNLWKCQVFATLYDKERLTKLLARAQRSGHELGCSHFIELIKLDGENATTRRHELEAATLEKKYTVHDLRAKVGKKSKHKGPKFAEPKSAITGIAQMNKVCEDYTKRWPGWEKAIFEYYVKAGADQFNEEVMATFKESLQAMVSLREELNVPIAYYQRIIGRGTKIMAAKPAVGVEETNGKMVLRKRPDLKTALATKKRRIKVKRKKIATKPGKRPTSTKKKTVKKKRRQLVKA